MKQNCWEFKNCGRIPGGHNIESMGICPAYSETKYDGINDGKNSGRFCWKISGTLCNGTIQGGPSTKMIVCLTCDFFYYVKKEESSKFYA